MLYSSESHGRTRMFNEVNKMSEQINTLNFTLSVQALDGEVLPSAVFRIELNISYGASVGRFQKGYYVKFNDNVYFVSQSSIQVSTLNEAEKLFAFLQKTQVPFTVNIRHEQTRSGYQYFRLSDINLDSSLYILKTFKIFRGLWREIEGALYQNKNVSIARFSDGKLDWSIELNQYGRLSFTQGSTISATPFANQGHLQIFTLNYSDVFAIPYYLYTSKEVKMFNHSIKKDVAVIPLGIERKIIKVTSETTQVISEDHDPINLPQGEYLLFHPIPRPQDAVD